MKKQNKAHTITIKSNGILVKDKKGKIISGFIIGK